MARVEDVAKYIINIFQIKAEHNLDDGMTNLRLQKLLYLAQGYYLAEYGNPLFENEIEAWKYGPVVPEIYKKYSEFNRDSLSDTMPEENTLSDQEEELILDVLSRFGKYSTGYLVEMSHTPKAPWAQVYNETRRNRIPKDSIREYFKEISSSNPIHAEKPLSGAVINRERGKTGHIILPADEYEDWEAYAGV